MEKTTTDTSPALWVLSFNTVKKQWHYDQQGRGSEWPQTGGWVAISEHCPEYQLQLFTYFLDFTPQRKKVSALAMKREWFRFKQWLHWLEACGVDCQTMRIPNCDKLEAIVEDIRQRSQPSAD